MVAAGTAELGLGCGSGLKKGRESRSTSEPGTRPRGDMVIASLRYHGRAWARPGAAIKTGGGWAGDQIEVGGRGRSQRHRCCGARTTGHRVLILVLVQVGAVRPTRGCARTRSACVLTKVKPVRLYGPSTNTFARATPRVAVASACSADHQPPPAPKIF
jgi:hypothetical protein